MLISRNQMTYMGFIDLVNKRKYSDFIEMEGSFSSITSPIDQGHYVKHQLKKIRCTFGGSSNRFHKTWDPRITYVKRYCNLFCHIDWFWVFFFALCQVFSVFYFYSYSITHKGFDVSGSYYSVYITEM